MKKIKIFFCDFWSNFDPYDNYFLDLLKPYFDIEVTCNPDYIIYSAFGKEYLKYDCIRIFYTGENLRPDFTQYDYGIGFDYVELGDRYIRCPYGRLFEHIPKIITAINQKKNYKKREKFCNFIYSNGNADRRRQEFFLKLNQYKKVDSGGSVLNNLGYKVEDKFSFQESYKFTIAFENSSAIGYTTEKIVDAFAAGTIPIYWGNPEIARDFNPKAFINCHDYHSFDEVIELVKRIDQDENLLMSYIAEPIFNDYMCQETFENNLKLFLFHIFNQDLCNARRRPLLLD